MARLTIDKQWARTVANEIVNVIGSAIGGNWKGKRLRELILREFRAPSGFFSRASSGFSTGFSIVGGPSSRPRRLMPIGGFVRRIVVGIQLRKTDNARSIEERIAPHVIPAAELFDGQRPSTWRGYMRAYFDHFVRRFREDDQETANADHRPVFLEADRATVEVKRARPKRVGRQAETETTLNAVSAVMPPSKQNLASLKDRAPTLLPLLKGNERVVFECLHSGATSQRDIASATGLTEGAVSKILDRIISKAG